MAKCLHTRIIRNPLYGCSNHADGRPVVPGENNWDPLLEVPCGKCLNCRTNRQNSWAFRLEFENIQTVRSGGISYFITFTYDDDHLTYGSEVPTLVKRDVQLFHKRLRKFGLSFRNFTIGEYGGKFSRPHYHGIYFFPTYLTADEVHHIMYPIWNMCAPERFTVDPFSIKDAKYVAKYSLKSPHLDFTDIEPNFMVCSRRPTIGYCFLESNMAKQIVNNQSYLVVDTAGSPYNLPRYYKQKLFTPLERHDIVEQYNQEQFERDLLVCGSVEALDRYRQEIYNRGLYLEMYQVNSMALADFGKDCKVTYSQYINRL